MGFKHEQFVGTVDDNLKCSICDEVLENPSQCKQGHLFCNDCIRPWLDKNDKCPVDNEKLKSDDLARSLVAKNIVDSHQVYCQPPNRDEVDDADAEKGEPKCDWTGKLESLAKHRETCPFQPVKCPSENCNIKIQRRELEDHDTICEYTKVECDEQCGVTLIRRDLTNHKRNDCPEVSLSCPNGCETNIKRKDINPHRETCPCQQVKCPNANCNTNMQRRELNDHDKICEYKKIECDEKCGMILLRRDLSNHKRNDCPEVRLACPNGCTEKRPQGPNVTSRIKRKDLEYHKTHTCGKTVVSCFFKDQGCPVQTARQDLEKHLQENMSPHILLMAKQNTQLQKKDESLLEKVESLNSSLEAKTVLLDERRAHFEVNQEEKVTLLKGRLEKLSEKCSSLEKQCSVLAAKNTELEEELSKAKDDLSTYTWVIHEYPTLTQKYPTGSYFKSPTFSFCGYKWYLMLYPNGDKNEGFFSLHLCVVDPKRLGRVPSEEVSVTYRLRVMSRLPGKDVSYKATMVFDKTTTVSKHQFFMKTNESLCQDYCDFLRDHRLVVKCTIYPFSAHR